MIARKKPVKAPRNASVIERLLKVRSPWPVRRNPVYAIATVQRITRKGCMEAPLDEQILPLTPENFIASMTASVPTFWRLKAYHAQPCGGPINYRKRSAA